MRKIRYVALFALMIIALGGCGSLGGALDGLLGDSGDSEKAPVAKPQDRRAGIDQYGAAMLETVSGYVAEGKIVEAKWLADDLAAAGLGADQQKMLSDLRAKIDASWKPDAESSQYNTDVLVPAKDFTGKYGYIDGTGKFVISARYTKADDFSEGLALVEEQKGQSYFIDRTGAKVLEVKPSLDYYFYDQTKKTVWMVRDGKDSLETYDGSFPIPLEKISIEVQGGFHDGLARCELRTYKVTITGAYTMPRQGTIYIDRTGKEKLFFPTGMWWLSDSEYQCRDFREGRALVLREKKGERLFGYIDTTGKWVAEPAFDAAGSFHDGLAAVMYPNTKRWGFIDLDGAVAMKPFYQSDSVDSFNDGLLICRDDTSKRYLVIRKDGSHAAELNFRGQDDETFDFARNICSRAGDGIVGAAWRKGTLGPGLVESFIGLDRNGKELFALSTINGAELLVREIGVFSNGRSFVRTYNPDGTEWWGVIDTRGNWVVVPTGDWVPVDNFSNGLGKVKMNVDGSFAWLDRAGKIVYKE